MYKLIVWGTGNSAANIFNQYLQIDDIYCFVESAPTRAQVWGKKIISPEELSGTDFDLLLIASNFSHEIYRKCELGLDINKIYFVYHGYFPLSYLNTNTDYVKNIMGDAWLEKMTYQFEVIVRNRYINNMEQPIPFIENS